MGLGMSQNQKLEDDVRDIVRTAFSEYNGTVKHLSQNTAKNVESAVMVIDRLATQFHEVTKEFKAMSEGFHGIALQMKDMSNNINRVSDRVDRMEGVLEQLAKNDHQILLMQQELNQEKSKARDTAIMAQKTSVEVEAIKIEMASRKARFGTAIALLLALPAIAATIAFFTG